MPVLTEQKMNKIKRIFGRLESDHPGEVENAARLLTTLLKNEGHTISTFINSLDGTSERDEDILVYENIIERLENEVEDLKKQLSQVNGGLRRMQPHAEENADFVAMVKAVFGDEPGWKRRCAQALGVSDSAVHHWISGKNIPSERSRKKVAEMLKQKKR